MKPFFSILVPLYNTPSKFLKEMLLSVKTQMFNRWELCLCDASDGGVNLEKYVKEVFSEDKRVVYKRLAENRGISENTNECIKIATGQYYVLLDHDDVLDSKALKMIYSTIQREGADFIYTDEAKFTDDTSMWFSPNFKPDFSKYELRSHNYICHLTCFSRTLLEEVGHFNKEYDGSQDHDLVLRLTEHAKRIKHIPEILYYWRVHNNSVSENISNKKYAIDAAISAVQAQLDRNNIPGKVVNHPPYYLVFHQKYEIVGTPKVLIVISNRDLLNYSDKSIDDQSNDYIKDFFERFEYASGYDSFDYLILGKEYSISQRNNHNIFFRDYSLLTDSISIGLFAQERQYDFLLFADCQSSIESPSFLYELLGIAQNKDVAFVGPKGKGIDGKVFNGGIAYSKYAKNGIVYRYNSLDWEAGGYENDLYVMREVSAIQSSCTIISTNKFLEIGGFSKHKNYYLIGACLKARMLNYINIWTPYAILTEPAAYGITQESDDDYILNTYSSLLLEEDPYYNKSVRYTVDHILDKNTPLSLIKKSYSTIKEGGMSELVKRARGYLKQSYIIRNAPISNTDNEVKLGFKDVLFINGCAPSVPHPPRYRVDHQREQLWFANVHSDKVYYEDLTLDYVKYYRLFIIFRCPYTDTIGEFIKRAHELNKLVLYDIDDLVIDTCYTDTIPYVQGLIGRDLDIYNDGVIRMGKTLKLCDGAITTTERLATELAKYVPAVHINRNTASERMYELSEKAIYKRDIAPYIEDKYIPSWLSYSDLLDCRINNNRRTGIVRVGYFSGSMTHNADFEMIIPAVDYILGKYSNVSLHIVGELEVPQTLQKYAKQIVFEPFTDWEKLPDLIASVDINIAPLTETIFNEAKSENKWVEAALVKVPTIASNVGAFARMIQNGETGLLCNTREEWIKALELLIKNEKERQRIANNCYKYVINHCTTMATAHSFANYIKSWMRPNVAFILPSTEISGGINVALKHASILKANGNDVFFICTSNNYKDYLNSIDDKFPVLPSSTSFNGVIDKGIATLWNTVSFFDGHRNVIKPFYLVQNKEHFFYDINSPLRFNAIRTYSVPYTLQYITISKWCQSWLKDEFDVEAKYAPNGIDLKKFTPIKRSFVDKVVVLIEGDSSIDYKNVDESFVIANKLDRSKYEVWYLSYNGEPKEWYRYEKFFSKVPYDSVPLIYKSCDILLKSSLLESFSYPPLEMMATGGYVVAVINDGNAEYLENGYNCLAYEDGDCDAAINAINRIVDDTNLREVLYYNGLTTVQQRRWEGITDDILSLYD